MSAVAEALPAVSPRLRDIAISAIGATCGIGAETISEPALVALARCTARTLANGRSIDQSLEDVFRRAGPADARLLWLARELRLSHVEVLAIALAAAVEDDPLVGRMVARVQTPMGGGRPTLGLLAEALAQLAPDGVMPALLSGAAMKCGLLAMPDQTSPMPDRSLAVPPALCLAIAGHDSEWPGGTIGLDEGARVPLPDATLAAAQRHAAALSLESNRALVIRSGSLGEARSAALAIADALGRRPLFLDSDKVAGLGPYLLLRRLIPVFRCELGPSERRRLPALSGYAGPLLAMCGIEGAIETAHGAAAGWILPVPSQLARLALWSKALGPGDGHCDLARQLAVEHRHGAGRIAYLGRLAHHHAALAARATPDRGDVIAAAWTGEGSGLDALAEPLRAPVADEALVLTPVLKADLESLLVRCRVRDDLTGGLGASARTRYRPGVRALFTGPSGTGKTLAAGWMATRLGLPLYRVDLASVTSKYIGETEKNLSQLLSRAEQAEVILLFDEADSLFGKRTEINDSNDRFANAQTNYLLQRIENYDGVVVLTSNSQARFDDAFARRLDFVIDFPPPGPQERRALWEAHLGPGTRLLPSEINRLAVLVDLSGGNTRNAVLAAAARARNASRAIEFDDLLWGVEMEMRKLGRQVPLELRTGR